MRVEVQLDDGTVLTFSAPRGTKLGTTGYVYVRDPGTQELVRHQGIVVRLGSDYSGRVRPFYPDKRHLSGQHDQKTHGHGGASRLAAAEARIRDAGWESANLRGLDPTIADEVADAAVKLAERYPVIFDTSYNHLEVAVPSQDCYAETLGIAGQHRITLSIWYFGDGPALNAALQRDYKLKWSARPDIKGVIDHEFGHVIDDNQNYRLEAPAGTPRAFAPSRYAMKNPAERLAETFSAIEAGAHYPSDTYEGKVERELASLRTIRVTPTGYAG